MKRGKTAAARLIRDEHEENEDHSLARALYFAESRLEPLSGGTPATLAAAVSDAVETFNARYFDASRRMREAQVAGVADPAVALGEAPAPPGTPGAVNWTPIGPSVVANGQAVGAPPVAGRITTLAIGPNGTRLYAGSANGGVWHSGDSGTSWVPLDEYFETGTPSGIDADSLSVGAIGVRFGATTAQDTVYIGTGEPNGNFDAYMGVGIRRFGPPSGGGAPAWTLEATNLAGAGIYRIIIDADDPERVFAATNRGLLARPAGGGATWTLLAPPGIAAATAATDLAAASTGADRRYYVAYQGGAVFALNPATNAFTSLTGVAGAGRVALSAARVPGGAADQRVVYALSQTGRLFLLRPGSAVTAFTEVTSMAPVTSSGQGWYDLCVEIEPGTIDRVWVAGDAIFNGSGGNWELAFFRGSITNVNSGTPAFGFANTANPTADATYRGLGVHADGHALGFAPGAASPVFCGNDGGVFRSGTGANGSFVARTTGLAITQITYLAQRADTDAVLFAGCQDNGTVRFRGEPAWFESPQGDGGGITVDPNDQYRILRQYVRTGRWVMSPTFTGFAPGLYTATDGGAGPGSWAGVRHPPIPASPTSAQITAVNGESAATGFYAPIASAADGPGTTRVLFGTNRVWLSEDWGGSWVTLPTGTNPYAGTGADATQDSLGGAVNALEFATGSRAFAATATAVSRFDRSGTTWTRTALPTSGLPPSRFITDLAVVDPTAGSLYATLGGSDTSHVYFLSGATATSWTPCVLSVGGAPLDVPCHAVVVDPDHTDTVYVGSDVGCHRGVRSGSTWTWTPFSLGLPQVSIVDLGVHRRSRLLRAGTHGRGVWEIELDSPSLPSPELYMRVNTADSGRIVAGQRRPWVENHADPTRKGFTVFHWMSPDIKVRRPSLPNLPTIGSPPDLLDFAANIGDYIDSNNVETIDLTGTSRAFVQVHNRSLDPIPGNDVRVMAMMTDASAGLPLLPAGFAGHIVNGDDPATWMPGSGWFAADATTPYRVLPGTLDARRSGIAAFNVDLSPLGLPATHDHVCLAAFATSLSMLDRLTATQRSLDSLTMQERRVVHRNLHAVISGSTPGTLPAPTTFWITLTNPFDRDELFDVIVDRSKLGGQLTLFLTQDVRPGKLTGIEMMSPDSLDEHTSAHLERWGGTLDHLLDGGGRELDEFGQQRLSRLADLDRRSAFVSSRGTRAALLGLPIPAGRSLTIAISWSPGKFRAGQIYPWSIVQRRSSDGAVGGGSNYAAAVLDTSRRGRGPTG